MDIEQLSLFDDYQKENLSQYVFSPGKLNEMFNLSLKMSCTKIYKLLDDELWFERHKLAVLNDTEIFSDGFISQFPNKVEANKFYLEKLKQIELIKSAVIVDEEIAKRNDVVYVEYHNDFNFTRCLYKVDEKDRAISYAPIWYSGISGYSHSYPSYYREMSTEEKILFCCEKLEEIKEQIISNLDDKPGIYYIDIEIYQNYLSELKSLNYYNLEYFQKQLSEEFLESELNQYQQKEIKGEKNMNWNVKEEVLEEVGYNGMTLKKASRKLRDDKDVVMTAVSTDGVALRYASNRLTRERDIVLAAVTNNGFALSYASYTFMDDKEIVMTAVQHAGTVLYLASEELKKDKDIVIAAVNDCPISLQYADKQLRNDEEVVLFAAYKDPDILMFVEISNETQIAVRQKLNELSNQDNLETYEDTEDYDEEDDEGMEME